MSTRIDPTAGRKPGSADVEALASLASPMHALLSRHGEGSVSAGPAAAMLRRAASRFVLAVSRAVGDAVASGVEGLPRPVSLGVAKGISGVADGYRRNAGRVPPSAGVTQGGEAVSASARVSSLVSGAVLGAGRRMAEVTALAAPLAKYVDGASVVARGTAAAPAYARVARVVAIVALSGGASVLYSGAAEAGSSRLQTQTRHAEVSVDDLFAASFGGMIRKTPVPIAQGPAASAPAAQPVSPAPARVAALGGPSPAFRTMAEQFLRVHGGNGAKASAVFDALLLDARDCQAAYGSSTRCKLYRDNVGVDLARERYEIRNPDGTGALLVTEDPIDGMRVVDPLGYSTVLQGGDHYEKLPADRSIRKTTVDGRPYFEPSQTFMTVAQKVVQPLSVDAIVSLGELVDKARACATGPRNGDCAVSDLGVRLDMAKGEFIVAGSWLPGQEPVVLARETAQLGLQVVNPAGLSKTLAYDAKRSMARDPLKDDEVDNQDLELLGSLGR